jgi:hypothetical protein
MSAAQTTAIEVADSALDLLRYGKEQLQWLGALMKAIQLDTQHNQGRTSIDLACIGHYLSTDCANYLSCEVEELQTQLNADGGVQ